MVESIISYLRQHTSGVLSQELSEVFLKFKNPDPQLAYKAVDAILKKDSRCFIDSNKRWHAMAKKHTGSLLFDTQFTAVFCLSDPSRHLKKALFISLWNVNRCENLLDCWLVDPRLLSSETNATLFGSIEAFDTALPSDLAAGNIYEAIKNGIPIFLSSYECALVHNTLNQSGYYLSDDYLLVSDLLKAAGVAIPRPLTLQTFLNVLEIQSPTPTEVRKCSAALQAGISELLRVIVGKGIETREQMEEVIYKESDTYFKGKEFSLKSVQSLSATPGVYGFKNQQNAHIYIGKAKNLKRRLLSYFRDTDESPDKINRLRQESHTLMTYQCGSELEALIYEYRLIRKHSPILNSKIDISERNGTYKPIQDCIILLPHVNIRNVMSFWLRENQKIVMKPIEVCTFDPKEITSELNNYFFGTSQPAEPTDFPELELATRWIKSHRDVLNNIDVYNSADANEIAESLGFSIKQLQRQ